MSTQIRVLAVVSVLVLATSVVAGQLLDGLPRLANPTDLPADIGSPNQIGVPARACLVAYDDMVEGTSYLPLSNTSPITGMPYTEYADDLHLTEGGALCSFSIGYFEPDAPTVDITITIYFNTADDDSLGDILAGPYTFPGLPGGFNQVTLTPADNPIIPKDVWFSITADPLTAGLVIAGGPPSVGTSDDVFLDVPGEGLVFFGGNPLANFMISLEVDPEVPTETATWSKIKSLYQ